MQSIEKYRRDSVRRFVRFMLGIEPPTYLFHQTLTFSSPQFDATAAKIRLNRFLKSRFLRGVVYAEERHQNKGIHYHVLLFYYEKHGLPFPPSKMRESVRALAFEAWNLCNDGRPKRVGNRFEQHDYDSKSLWYLMKEAPFRDAQADAPTTWWGKWNVKFLVKRHVPPTKQEVANEMQNLLPPPVPLPLGLRCSARRIQTEMRDFMAHCISNPAEEWEQAKRSETGMTGQVSNAELLAFRKRLAAEWLKRNR